MITKAVTAKGVLLQDSIILLSYGRRRYSVYRRGIQTRFSLKLLENRIMRLLKVIIIAACSVYACGAIEDSQDIPEPGTYTSIDGRDGFESRLTISKKEKGYTLRTHRQVTTVHNRYIR